MNKLGFSHTTFAPGYTSESHPDGLLTFDELVDAFYQSYTIWVLRYAQQLATDGDAGFAILLLLHPYFQMYARYKNGKKTDDVADFRDGFCAVFAHELDEKGIPKTTQNQIAEYLRQNMRNELAHINLTGKGIGLSGSRDEAIWWSLDENGVVDAVGLNPQEWVKCITEHFDGYIERLREPANISERKNFIEYSKKRFQ